MNEKDFVFGIQTVTESIKAGTEIEKIFIQSDLAKSTRLSELITIAKSREIPVSKVPTAKLHSITRKNHQGVIALISAIRYVQLSNIIQGLFEKGENPLILLLDGITDVRNFGAISRTAECAGVHAIVVPLKGGAQIGSDAMKTSSGALNLIPVCREKDLLQSIRYLQESGLQVIACTEKAEEEMYQAEMHLPTVVVLGSEDTGIQVEILRKCDAMVKIPMAGRIGSLNVSVAAGVILYEIFRQRKFS